MPKLAVIINGKPGSGKDALCDAVIAKGRARKISSIDPIIAIAKQGGWDGVKTPASRKLLSDLKRAFAEFNDLPNRYVVEQYNEFCKSDDDILFVHIREKDQIESFLSVAGENAVTLLILRPNLKETMGNISDDGIHLVSYDYKFRNDKPLGESSEEFCAFMKGILENHGTLA